MARGKRRRRSERRAEASGDHRTPTIHPESRRVQRGETLHVGLEGFGPLETVTVVFEGSESGRHPFETADVSCCDAGGAWLAWRAPLDSAWRHLRISAPGAEPVTVELEP